MESIKYIVVVLIILWLGGGVGYCVKWQLDRMKSYDGVIIVTRDDEKILYSLEILEDPDILAFKDEVVFKVKHSVEVGAPRT